MNQQQAIVENSPRKPSRLGGYRARYQEFVERQLQKHKPSVPVEQVSQWSQGLMSVAIFVALLVGILTLFGIGLSQWDRTQNLSSDTAVRAAQQSNQLEAAPLLPAPPAQPTGHAEIKKKSRK